MPETDIDGAYKVGEKLRKIIENHCFPINKRVTISVGIIQHTPGESCNELFKRLDDVLYYSKNKGKNITVVRKTS